MYQAYYSSKTRKPLLAKEMGVQEVSTTGLKRLLRF